MAAMVLARVRVCQGIAFRERLGTGSVSVWPAQREGMEIMTGGAVRDDEDQRAKNVCTKEATAGTGSVGAGTVWWARRGRQAMDGMDLRGLCGRPWMERVRRRKKRTMLRRCVC